MKFNSIVLGAALLLVAVSTVKAYGPEDDDGRGGSHFKGPQQQSGHTGNHPLNTECCECPGSGGGGIGRQHPNTLFGSGGNFGRDFDGFYGGAGGSGSNLLGADGHGQRGYGSAGGSNQPSHLLGADGHGQRGYGSGSTGGGGGGFHQGAHNLGSHGHGQRDFGGGGHSGHGFGGVGSDFSGHGTGHGSGHGYKSKGY